MLHFFTDPVLRAPTLGSILMGVTAALMGVCVLIRKRSLLGETLSHATYPGITLAILLGGYFALEDNLSILVLLGAFLTALTGFMAFEWLEKKWKVSVDAALTAILALFFGIGVTLASLTQHFYAHLVRLTQAYLYGQVATMTDIHIVIYGTLTATTLLFVFFFYKALLALSFDRQFAQTIGLHRYFVEPILFTLIVLALVVGIRCVGVVLMSAMLIAPAVAARQFTNRLGTMFILSALFGGLSGFFGVYFSVLLSKAMSDHYAIPTGPMIVLLSGSFALYALFFAPKRGLVIRYMRIIRFRTLCVQENLIKSLWRFHQAGNMSVPVDQLNSSFFIRFFLFRLTRKGLIEKEGKNYTLTPLGYKRGAKIVRLHRLWEVYLVHSLGLKIERVHKSAEEMEHILTPTLEKRLTDLLDNPQQDPHDQPIPACEEEGLTHVH